MADLNLKTAQLAARTGQLISELRTLINGNIADLSALATTAKSNIVAAINELKTLIDEGTGGVSSWFDLTDKPTTFPPTIGSGPADAVAGNDPRLANARTPTAHKSSHATGGGDPISPSDIGAAPTTHSHSAAEISDSTAAGRAILTAATAAAQRSAMGAVSTSDARLTNTRERTIHAITETSVESGSDGDFIRLDAGEYSFTGPYSSTYAVKPNDGTIGQIIIHNNSSSATLALYTPGYSGTLAVSIAPGQDGVFLPSSSGGSWVAMKSGGLLAFTSDITKAAVGLSSVENTALSSWTGNPSQSSVGTITTGTWHGTAIDHAYGGTGATTAAGAVANLLVPYDEATTSPLSITSANAATYNGKFVLFSGSTAHTVTFDDTIPAGFNFMWMQTGAGQVTFAGSGISIRSYGSLVKSAAQYASGSAAKMSSGNLALGGILA